MSTASVTLETLLDQAEALLAQHPDGQPPRPDFPLPFNYEEGTPFALLQLKDNGVKGRGWWARNDIPAGTILCCEKPIAMIMDWQDPSAFEEEEQEEEDDTMEEDEEPGHMAKLNELLVLELLKKIAQDASVWTDKLSDLFPRNTLEDLEVLSDWVCQDDTVFVQVETLLQKLTMDEATVAEISKRLPLIVRYNVLSAETLPELLVHPSPEQGYAALSGTGLYHYASFFNHDSQPNASRYSVGDVLWIVTNQDVQAGDEVCMSYLEHDVLCEPAPIRTIMLHMDFAEPEQEGSEDVEEEAPDMPVVDLNVQNELMQLDPISERLPTIDALMQQALGEAGPEEEEQEESSHPPWFDCDVQNLRILKALTLDSLGRVQEALPIWQECVAFCHSKLPPHDESSVVMHVQTALCALQCNSHDQAQQHAAQALAIHKVLFGGGVKRFLRRYRREFQLALRPTLSYGDTTAPPHEQLWPMVFEEE